MHSASHNDLSDALLAISQSLADRSQLSQSLDAVLTAARQITFANHGVIYVLDQTGEAMIPSAAHNNELPLLITHGNRWLLSTAAKPTHLVTPFKMVRLCSSTICISTMGMTVNLSMV